MVVGVLCFNISAQAQVKENVKEGAQEVKEGAQKGAQEVKEGAKSVGNKTAEVTSKGAARVTDQVYDGKYGPNGQTIYIDNNSKYYWIDDKGRKNYVAKGSLRDKK